MPLFLNVRFAKELKRDLLECFKLNKVGLRDDEFNTTHICYQKSNDIITILIWVTPRLCDYKSSIFFSQEQLFIP